MSEKRLYYKLCPELVDGQHYSIVDDKRSVMDAIKTFLEEDLLENGVVGEAFKVEIVEMTPEEFEALSDL